MMDERISATLTFKDGTRKNIELYDCAVSSLDDCFTSEKELAWYVLECAEYLEEINEAVKIEADSAVFKSGKVIQRINVQVR